MIFDFTIIAAIDMIWDHAPIRFAYHDYLPTPAICFIPGPQCAPTPSSRWVVDVDWRARPHLRFSLPRDNTRTQAIRSIFWVSFFPLEFIRGEFIAKTDSTWIHERAGSANNVKSPWSILDRMQIIADPL